MQPHHEATEPRSDVALQLWIGIHNDDYPTCIHKGTVPLCILPFADETKLTLHETGGPAVMRAKVLYCNRTAIGEVPVLLLRVLFSRKGFDLYSTRALGPNEPLAPVLYKTSYPDDTPGSDYGTWAFHGDLPLQQRSADGDVLIQSGWVQVWL